MALTLMTQNRNESKPGKQPRQTLSMELNASLPEKIRHAGIAISDKWEPGDLGSLIHLHGVQNFQDYGFNAIHEAYCARVAVDFILNPRKDRSFAWIARKSGE